jgi:hypothetical protein
MKKKVLFLPLALTIVGCPGERINIPEQRSVMTVRPPLQRLMA